MSVKPNTGDKLSYLILLYCDTVLAIRENEAFIKTIFHPLMSVKPNTGDKLSYLILLYCDTVLTIRENEAFIKTDWREMDKKKDKNDGTFERLTVKYYTINFLFPVTVFLHKLYSFS